MADKDFDFLGTHVHPPKPILLAQHIAALSEQIQ